MAFFKHSAEHSRPRRGRRLGRAWRRSCVLTVFSVSMLLLIFFSFFGDSLHGHAHQELFMEEVLSGKWKNGDEDLKSNLNISAELEGSVAGKDDPVSALPNLSSLSRNRKIISDIGVDDNTNANAQNHVVRMVHSTPKSKSRKHYVPCDIEFMESVDDLVEPQQYMNFTQFSLEYVAKEEKLDGSDTFLPRFGGHQTLEEREKSFHATNQTVHCGFVKGPEGYPSTGFDLDGQDKEFMSACHVVVSSCIFGSSDFLRRPTSKKQSSISNFAILLAPFGNAPRLVSHVKEIGTYSKKNVCFMMFVDELTLKTLSSEGEVPDNQGYIGLWRIVKVKNLPYTDMRKTGKVPKFLSHQLFPSARYSIWIDSKMRLNADPLLILEYFLWRKKSEYAISNHYDRHCVWEEVLQNKRLNKYNHTIIDEQFQLYQSDGLTKFNESDMNPPLPSYVPEGSFIARAHTPMSNLFSCLWFNEVNRFTSRDQLSFAYSFLKLKRMNPGKPFFLNMFKDCERRAIAKLFHHRAEEMHPPPAI